MPHIRILRRIPLLVGVLALGILLGLAASAGSAQRRRQPEQQPHMRLSLDALRSAEHHLREATGDKGGHRIRAIQLVNQAEAEVQRGIEWDNTHH